MNFDKELDVPMPLKRPRPTAASPAGFYRTLGVPAFWDGCHIVRETTPGGSVRLIRVLRRAAEAGEPMADVPEVREWQAHGR
jgi:hypothetical protein